jgi:hypothetical protein
MPVDFSTKPDKNKYVVISLYRLLPLSFAYLSTKAGGHPFSNATLASLFSNRYTGHTGKKVSSGIH